MKRNRGITLISLVITIIILLILVGISITQLTSGGIIERAKQARQKHIVESMRDTLILALQEIQIDKLGGATLEDITQESIDSKIQDYNSKVELNSLIIGKTVIMQKNDVMGEFLIDEHLNIIQIDDSQINLEIYYNPISRNEDKMNIVITVKEENGLQKIKCPDDSEIVCSEQDKQVEIKYEVAAKLGAQYEFKILLSNGQERKKILVINKVLYSYTGKEQELTLEQGKYKIECYGARGGNGHGNSTGGFGGYMSGITNFSENVKLYLYVGQAGQDDDSRRDSFNGGAIGGYDNYGGTENGGSGGGATDIRLTANLSSRIIVAGGGGGAGRMELVPRWSRGTYNRTK